MNEEEIVAVVEKVVEGGKHGPYVVTSHDTLGSVTFLLDRIVWQEKELPEPGTYVVLSMLQKKRAGWRAKQSRLFTPADEKKEVKFIQKIKRKKTA